MTTFTLRTVIHIVRHCQVIGTHEMMSSLLGQGLEVQLNLTSLATLLITPGQLQIKANISSANQMAENQ